MKYKTIVQACFLERPNRFIAHCLYQGKTVVAHVRNTGRCRELLLPGTTVYLEKSENPHRKTPFSLVAVEKQGLLINMDSQAPNKVVKEWLEQGGVLPGFSGRALLVRPETLFGASRFDFYLETEKEKAFIEVKGVTLEKDRGAFFPDAPTERGIKHVKELIQAVKKGYNAYLLFVIQFAPARFFAPNEVTHPAFGQALRQAREEGVQILAYDCDATAEELVLRRPVPVCLEGEEQP